MANMTTTCAPPEKPAVAPYELGPLQETTGRSVSLWFVLFASATVLGIYLFCRAQGRSEALGMARTWVVAISFVFALAMGWLWLRVAFRHGARLPASNLAAQPVITPQAYREHGLGPVDGAGGGNALYVDMVKRAVSNVLYQDRPLIYYDHRQRPVLAPGFDLSRRMMGEDGPTEAQTIIGLCRLDNIRFCVQQVLRDNVPGDLVEAGVFRGGAAVFMRAVLKAHNVTDRRVFACDTFTPIAPKRPNWFLIPILQGFAAIPSRRWRRWLFFLLQTHLSDATSFPYCENPEEDLIEFLMWHIRNPAAIPTAGGCSVEEVRSLFARYGLLDGQVVFLKGFFADTFPTAPLSQVSVMRLDGDTYESTRDAITLLYPKLSPGGYCIIDDYYAYKDCRRAVDEYRGACAITDEIVPIDNLAVYWRKSM